MIGGNTVINTDPTITTNGQTDFGTIYRGSEVDGPFSTFAFGSTSSFDTSSGFDAQVDGTGAIFKFTALQLAGSPTVNTGEGPTNLGLIAVESISSSAPGGALTFSGNLNGLLLATVNGPINLGSEISFSGFNDLTIYARGALSDLTLNSNVNVAKNLNLYAQHDLNVTSNPRAPVISFVAGNNINLSHLATNETITETSGNVTLRAGESINATQQIQIGRLNGGIASGLNVMLDAGNELNVGTDLLIEVGNSEATLNSGATISVMSNNDISVGGLFSAKLTNSFGGQLFSQALIDLETSEALNVGGALSLQILNQNNGQIGDRAAIFLNTSGDLNAASVDVFINNANGGSISGAAEIGSMIPGDMNVSGDAFLGISARNEGSGGGTIGSNATVSLHLNTSSVGGVLQGLINTNGGGSIAGDATIELVASAFGTLSADQGIAAYIADTAFGPESVLQGGNIGGNAVVTLQGGDIITTSTAAGLPGTDLMALEASIYSNAGGSVGGSAIVNVMAGNQISAPGTALFWVANGNYQNIGPGQIGEDAMVNLSAPSISTGNLQVQILNYGGSQIGSNADVNITANTLSVNGDLDSQIDNSADGQIGGHAVINSNIGDSATISGNASYQIFGSSGAESAAINFNGGSYSVSNDFRSTIDGAGTIAINGASIHADVIKVGAFGDSGILTIGSGTLNADTTLKLYAGGSSGTINFVADVTLSGNSAKTLAANTINIFNGVTLTINGTVPANLYTNNPNFAESSGGNNVHLGVINGTAGHEIHPFDANTPPFEDLERATASATANASPTPSQTSVAASGSNGTGRREPKPPVLTAVTGDKTGTEVNVTDTNQIVQMLEDPATNYGASADRPSSLKKQKNSRNRGRKWFRPAAERERRQNHPRINHNRLPAP